MCWPIGTGAVLGVLKNLQGLRNEMAHLCTNLQAYLMFEVLERAWTQFTAQIAAAPDLDSLIGTQLHPCSEHIIWNHPDLMQQAHNFNDMPLS